MQKRRRERIELETARHRITGEVTLSASGMRSRVSDVLNAAERDFISLTGVTLEPLDGGPVRERGFLAVSRHHIVFVTPLGDDEADTDTDTDTDQP